MNIAQKAKVNAVNFEAKKDRLSQNQGGDWKLTVTVAADSMPQSVLTAPMGTRYVIALVEINDQEEPVEQKTITSNSSGIPNSSKRDWNSLAPSQQAGILCSEPDFQRWITGHSKWGSGVKDPNIFYSSELARHYVTKSCQISSRSEIDKGSYAEGVWNEMVGDYRAHQRYGEVV